MHRTDEACTWVIKSCVGVARGSSKYSTSSDRGRRVSVCWVGAYIAGGCVNTTLHAGVSSTLPIPLDWVASLFICPCLRATHPHSCQSNCRSAISPLPSLRPHHTLSSAPVRLFSGRSLSLFVAGFCLGAGVVNRRWSSVRPSERLTGVNTINARRSHQGRSMCWRSTALLRIQPTSPAIDIYLQCCATASVCDIEHTTSLVAPVFPYVFCTEFD